MWSSREQARENLVGGHPDVTQLFDRLLIAYIRHMGGRFTRSHTWSELVALYRLTLGQPARGIAPTTEVDTVVRHEGVRELVPMGRGLRTTSRRKLKCTSRVKAFSSFWLSA